MTAGRRLLSLLLLTALVVISLPEAANAASLTCVNGTPIGVLIDEDPACSYAGIQHIFGTIICYFVSILNDVLSKVYCGLQYSLTHTLSALFTLYIGVFGAQVLLGITQLTVGEIIIRMLKIAGVWAFVTQASWGIGYAFTFFVSVITSGTWWVVSTILPAAGAMGPSVMPIYHYIDTLIFAAVTGPFTEADNRVIGFFIIMSYTLPPLFMMAAYWLWSTFTLLARTLISFMLGVSAIAFLITLSPIFLSFMLFRLTFHLFESWLRYMVSFSLQIVVVFAIITMWIQVMSHFGNFFNDLSRLIFPWNGNMALNQTVKTNQTWVICPHSFSFTMTGPVMLCNNSNFDPINNEADRKDAIKPDQFAQYRTLLFFIFYNLTTLILIAYAFQAMLKGAPMIARDLVGPDMAPALKGGWGERTFGRVTGTPNQSGRFGRRHYTGLGSADERVSKMGGGAAADMVARSNEYMQNMRNKRTIG